MEYTRAVIFTKKGNLLPYFNTSKIAGRVRNDKNAYDFERKCCEAEREIELVALFRYDNKGNCICKIKCPVNPIPVRGEFETPRESAVIDFLRANGWTFQRRFNPQFYR